MGKFKDFAKKVLILMPINHTDWGMENNLACCMASIRAVLELGMK